MGIESFFIALSIALGIFFVLYFIGICIFRLGKKLVKRDAMKNNLDNIDLKKTKEYYREILEVNSPLMLGYIDDLELNISENELVAELLYLKMKKIIEFKDGRIERNMSINEQELLTTERYFLKNIVDGKLDVKNDYHFNENLKKHITENALLKEQLITNKSPKYNEKYFAVFILLFLIATISNNPWIIMGCVIATLIPAAYIDAYRYMHVSELKGLAYKRTKKGKEINKKIEGLKNYLKDYSMLDEKDSEMILLWEDYLIYSVLFGQNQKIVEEYRKYIV